LAQQAKARLNGAQAATSRAAGAVVS